LVDKQLHCSISAGVERLCRTNILCADGYLDNKFFAKNEREKIIDKRDYKSVQQEK